MTAAVVWVYLYLVLRHCLQNQRKDIQDVPPHCPLTSSF